jgi:hypothetical protein
VPTAPTDIAENLRYRREIIALGDSSKLARDDIWLACQRDPAWFAATFLYTFDPQNYADAPERPLVPWSHQADAMRKVSAALGKHNLIFPKSRRMGVTTLVLAMFFHRWRFLPMQSFLLLSAKEDRVDKKGDPSSLMWKLDHANNCLPKWLRAPVSRAQLRFENDENGSVINGESTNSDADRGGVRTAVLGDEVASMPNASEVLAAIQPLTNSLFLVSTPKGAHGAFYQLYEKWMRECPDWVIRLHWTQHPRFSQGLYHDSQGKPRSPWYDNECLRAPGPRWIAQELDINFNEAGGQFFEPTLIDRLLGEGGTIKQPSDRGELAFDEEGHYSRWQVGPQGRVLLWLNLHGNRPQKDEYICGVDISSGKGGDMSSQSAASIVNKTTGRKVAEFKTSHMTPTTFARQVVALSRWFHDAKLIWGSQGPGGDFQVTVKHCKYYNKFKRPGDGNKEGYVESPEGKLSLFGNYQDALHRGRFINPSKEALEECRQFIFARDTVVHSKAIQQDVDPEHAGKLHGDIVVADAMAAHLLPHLEPKEAAAASEPELGTYAWRAREVARIQERNRQEDWLVVADALESL